MNSEPSAVVVEPAPSEVGVDIRQTHTGIVVLAGDRAYKAKKPVLTDFLDFRTPERREEACAREVALNRRLAPDSYLGIAHLRGVDDLDEPVIVMRRYPDSTRLATIVVNGQPAEDALGAVAEHLARFHRTAARSQRIDAAGSVAGLASRWDENLAELRRHTAKVVSADTVADIARLVHQYLVGQAVLFTERVTDRRVVDGHGDLIADDIFCLAGGPVLLDCLEFDDDLRYVDGIDDAAFLAMDLEFLGHGELAEYFMSQYRAAAEDAAPTSLVHFYIAYRATVRAKVDCIRFGQGQCSAATDARRHLDLALAHLRKGTVLLVLVGGEPGTGKTTVSQALGRRLGADTVSTDDIRQQLAASGALEGGPGEYNSGLYRPDKMEQVYDAMLQIASKSLGEGRSVILDATWRDPRFRARASRLADQYHCPIVQLKCAVDQQSAEARIRHRRGSTSQVTPQIAAIMRQDAQEWVGAQRIDTSGSIAEAVDHAEQLCRVRV